MFIVWDFVLGRSSQNDFFKLLYQVLLGQEQGPRMGSFIKLYGIDKTILLIDKVINQQSNNKIIND